VDLVYICNPNNPTGIAEDANVLEAFIKDVAQHRLVMVDETFIDCLDNGEATSLKRLVRDYNNVIVSRTFSKLWGMAGFRIGYMLAHPQVIAKLKATVPTLEMQNRIGAAAAIGAYGDEEFMKFSRMKMKESRQLVFDILEKHGLTYLPSDINFVAFQASGDGDEFVKKMYEQGVLLKNVSFNGQTWVRVSCGAPNELAAFDQALSQVL
jgi:histidinol-phosphate aminotransferase